ncbi:deoxyuridine 5'-triphosphate nucleotidohydrolase-like [Populus nigra]|uniref:deoxyuridine 5'-triphosphate nucleotidohydrolase-like n=1 Tax=Populus nigra TaxID=3691 RepID=UPI002B2699AA|nr:deoxyuridine 5'-triphosphate nucleotidohydrolase-like [Populus nigra]
MGEEGLPGGAVAEAGGGALVHGRRLQAALRLFPVAESEVVPLPSSSVSISFRFLSFLLPLCVLGSLYRAKGRGFLEVEVRLPHFPGRRAAGGRPVGVAGEERLPRFSGKRPYLGYQSNVDFKVKVGDRIVQLILEKIVTPDVMEVEDLDATVRGVGGFGSIGV